MAQEAQTRMKRVVFLILVLLLFVDLAEDGYLGKVNFYLPNHSAKTSVTSCPHSDSGHTDFRYEFASTELPGSPPHCEAHPVTLPLPLALQIMHCCHLSSAGGIPL
jgi:hypothetical protein